MRVLIGDDYEPLRRSMVHVLQRANDIEVVGDTATLEDTLELIATLRPDVVVVDDYLPPLPADHIAALIQPLPHRPALLVVTIHDDITLARRSLAAGVRGYLHKSLIYEELEEAVRTVYSGGTYVSARIQLLLDKEPAASRLIH
jgi:DNA-binding NarL/FixJ family response regulator